MIEKEIDGRKYYCFEPSETEARLKFEKALISEETVDKLFKALMAAMSECERDKRNAWLQLEQTLKAEFNVDFDLINACTYNWLIKGFEIQDNPSANNVQAPL